MNQDRRGTRFEFGPSPKRSRPNENGDDAGDQIRIAFHETFDSRNEKEPRLKQALTSSSAQVSTRNPTPPRSTIIDELYAPQSQDPWKEFKPLLQILQGVPAVLAQSIPPQEQLYAIRSVATADKDKHLRSIQQLSLFPGGGIDRIRDIFDWAGKLFIVTEYVRPNLSQIITCEIRPTEAQLAFIAHRVSTLPELSQVIPADSKDIGQPCFARGTGIGTRLPDVDFRPDPFLLYTCPW